VVVALALLFALPADASHHPVTRATTARDGTVLIGGKAQFLVGAGWPTPASIPRALTLGIDFLQENGPGATQLSISRAVGTNGWILPEYTVRHVQAHYRNTIGYSLPDEPDGNGLLPATADPARGTRLPNTLRAAKTGKLIVQTITSHFMKERPKFDGIGDAEYLGYIRNADVVLTDIYPFAHGCVEAGTSLSMVYDAMVELKALAPARARPSRGAGDLGPGGSGQGRPAGDRGDRLPRRGQPLGRAGRPCRLVLVGLAPRPELTGRRRAHDRLERPGGGRPLFGHDPAVCRPDLQLGAATVDRRPGTLGRVGDR
jgi:hypothetical protein